MNKNGIKAPNERIRVQAHCPDSLTQQSHMDSTDVDKIVARFERTGTLPETRQQAQYGDVTHLQGELTEMLSYAQEVKQTFQTFKDGWNPQPQPTPSGPAEQSQQPASQPA